MPRYDVFLEGRTESSTCYFGVAVMADDQKEAEFLGHEAGRVKHQECDEIEVVGVMPVTSTRNAGKRRLCWRIPLKERALKFVKEAIDHIQDAPAVSQQELRSYMLPWFSPFAAPWCGKIQRAFPKAYVTMNFELILVPRTNTYINLNHCSTPDEFKAEVIEGVSRFAFKAFTKPLCKEHLDGINKLLDTKFTPEDMEYIYTNLGNGINHELCMKFVKSGYDLKVIEESV